ncbi:hypothetical protein BC628DRAFT_61369 [Trametes gibbosa]|nr:hypothetical protein BC628DRAFT_61369 [Trametes gibbosa]
MSSCRTHTVSPSSTCTAAARCPVPSAQGARTAPSTYVQTSSSWHSPRPRSSDRSPTGLRPPPARVRTSTAGTTHAQAQTQAFLDSALAPPAPPTPARACPASGEVPAQTHARSGSTFPAYRPRPGPERANRRARPGPRMLRRSRARVNRSRKARIISLSLNPSIPHPRPGRA